MKCSDKRSKKVTEFIEGIKILKYYGWEDYAEDTVFNIRLKEASCIAR